MIVLLALSSKKDAPSIRESVLEQCDELYLLSASHLMPLETLSRAFQSDKVVVRRQSMASTVREVLARVDRGGERSVVVIQGSFYMMAEVMEVLGVGVQSDLE